MKGKTRFGKGEPLKEGSAKDMREDKKLAKKHGMSMEEWEASPMDAKHDAGKIKKFAMGGAPISGAPMGNAPMGGAPTLPDPRLRIPQTKGVTAPPAGAQPPRPQPQPAMKKGGSVKCMKQGGVTSAEMKKMGRNMARVANQKSATKPQSVPSAATKKSGSAVIKGVKKGWGIARGR